MLNMLAQVGGDPHSGLGSTLAPWANLTAVGALIFFMGWILVKALPKILEAQQTRDKLFTESIAHVVSRAEAQQEIQRQHDEKQTERIVEAVDGLGQEVRQYANGRDRSSGGGR